MSWCNGWSGRICLCMLSCIGLLSTMNSLELIG